MFPNFRIKKLILAAYRMVFQKVTPFQTNVIKSIKFVVFGELFLFAAEMSWGFGSLTES